MTNAQTSGVKLFVGGIPYRMTADELRATFAQAGEVLDVFIPMDRMTGRPRGFAFVTMANQDGADKAISMFHDQEVGGRRIAVNVARPLEDRPGRAPQM
ncbi:RNA-binding protein [Patescibacteria group bacterium]|nr:RNA-binding protein [Patescibacteria group bacterium]